MGNITRRGLRNSRWVDLNCFRSFLDLLLFVLLLLEIFFVEILDPSAMLV